MKPKKMKKVIGYAPIDRNGDISWAMKDALPWICATKKEAKDNSWSGDRVVMVEIREIK